MYRVPASAEHTLKPWRCLLWWRWLWAVHNSIYSITRYDSSFFPLAAACLLHLLICQFGSQLAARRSLFTCWRVDVLTRWGPWYQIRSLLGPSDRVSPVAPMEPPACFRLFCLLAMACPCSPPSPYRSFAANRASHTQQKTTLKHF